MKRVVPKCYFDKAKQIYPNEENKTRLMDIAIMLKIIANSHYGKFRMDLQLSWLEQQTHNLKVAGSSPAWSTTIKSL